MLKLIVENEMRRQSLSLRTAGKKIGISHMTLKRVLDGQSIDLDTLILVCKWLGISPAAVLNVECTGTQALASKLAMLIETRPGIAECVETLVDDILNNCVDPEIISDIAGYATFRVKNTGRKNN